MLHSAGDFDFDCERSLLWWNLVYPFNPTSLPSATPPGWPEIGDGVLTLWSLTDRGCYKNLFKLLRFEAPWTLEYRAILRRQAWAFFGSKTLTVATSIGAHGPQLVGIVHLAASNTQLGWCNNGIHSDHASPGRDHCSFALKKKRLQNDDAKEGIISAQQKSFTYIVAVLKTLILKCHYRCVVFFFPQGQGLEAKLKMMTLLFLPRSNPCLPRQQIKLQ